MKALCGITAVMLSLVLLAAVQVYANEVAATARNLAENVLGAGSVTSLTLADGGAMILIRWESATFRANQKVDALREGLAVEAQLATGSILGRLFTVSRVRFSIKRSTALLATGENNRSVGLKLTYAASIGGGTYVPKAATGQSSGSKSGGTSSAKD